MSDNFNLQIKNYQNIRDAKLTFVPGLNCIVGASNNGKSACIRAIETAIYNLARESHVTLGETISMVGIEYNGHKIIWRRDTNASSQVSYQIDGKVYTKVGRGQPDLVAQALNITELELNNKKFRINFGKQMSYPFLLDCTPSEFFKFIVQSDDEDVTGVLDTMKKDFQDMKTNIKVYEASRDSLGQAYQKEAADYNNLRPKLEYAKKILDIDWKVQEYKELLSDSDTFKKSTDIISNYGVTLTRQQELYDNLNATYNSISALKTMYEVLGRNTESYKTSKDQITQATEELKEYQEFMEKSKDYPAIRNSLNQIQVVEAHRQSIEQALSSARKYHDIVENDTPRLDSLVKTQELIDEAYNYVGSKIDVVKKLEEDKKILHDNALEVFRLQKVVEDLERRVAATYKIIGDYEEELKEFPICPHCGAPVVNGKYCEHEEE